MSDRFEMVGVDARMGSAQVVGVVVARAGTTSERKTHAVGSLNAAIQREVAVSAAVLGSRPEPTRPEIRAVDWDRSVLVDLCPEPELRVTAVGPTGQWVAVSPGSPVVEVAPDREPAWLTPAGVNSTHRGFRRGSRAQGAESSPSVLSPLPETLSATAVSQTDEQVVSTERMAVDAVRCAISEGWHGRTSIHQPALSVTYD